VRLGDAKWFALHIAIVIGIFACHSTKFTPDGGLLDHQRKVVELESRNQELERRLGQYNSAIGRSIGELKAIRERSSGVEGKIDEVIDLFGRYSRAVEQLIQDYNSLRAAAEDNS
jgi:chromosome segregation ATPase